MANQVRRGKGLPSTKRLTRAVNTGPSADSTSTLATVVKLSAIMKAVNMVVQHRPDSHSTGSRQGMRPKKPGPRHQRSNSSMDSSASTLRQNVISKPCAP